MNERSFVGTDEDVQLVESHYKRTQEAIGDTTDRDLDNEETSHVNEYASERSSDGKSLGKQAR